MRKKTDNVKHINKKTALEKILLFLIVVFAVGAVLGINIYYELLGIQEDQFESLTNSMTAIMNNVHVYEEFVSDYNEYDEEDTKVYIEVLKKYFQRNGHGRVQMTNADAMIKNSGYIYYINADRSIDKGSDSPPLILTDEELDYLLANGSSWKGVDTLYSAVAGQDEYIVVLWFQGSVEKELDKLNYVNVCRSQAMMLDEDNTIIYLKEGDYSAQGGIGSFKEGDKITIDARKSDGDFERVFFSDSKGESYIGVMGQVGAEGYYCIPFFPLSLSVKDTINAVSYPVIIFIYFIIISILISLSITRRSVTKKHLFGQFYYYTGAIRHIVSAVIFNIVIMLIATLIITMLNIYNESNEIAKQSLTYLNDSINENENLSELLEDYYTELMIDRTRIVDWMMSCDQNWVKSIEPENLAEMIGANKVDIYDSNGKAIYSEIGYDGFVLTKDADNEESRVWDLYADINKTLSVKDNDTESDYIVASRLKGQDGVIVIHINCDNLDKIKEHFSIDNALISSDFNNAAKVYIDKDYKGIVKWVDIQSSDIKEYDNTLNEKVMMDGYSGRDYFGNVNYYFNTKRDDKKILLSAVKVSNLLLRALSSIGYTTINYLIMGIIIVMYTCIVRSNKEKILDEYEAAREKEELDDCLRRKFGACSIVSIIGFTLLIIYENYSMDNTIFDYLFKDSSVHELNIYSTTALILMVLWCVIFIKIQGILMNFVTNNMGPQAVTAGHMISSLVKVILWVAIILFALYQLGVNSSTLIASAGITSVVIGIGAQSTVSDIISGFFIVLEGHVRVGDWIRVNDFRGIVTAVGIRTTKITFEGDTISINNSNMTNVVNLSKEMSRLNITFQVEYGTDLILLENVINGNSERYLRECPTLTIAPCFWSVSDMAASGLEIHIVAYTFERDRKISTNCVLRTTYDILMENGIGVPYTTITISNSEHIRY